MLAVLPALVILLYSGVERRRHSIENAKRDVLLLTHAMAEAQKEITRSTRKILSTLSILPAIQTMDLQASSDILKAVLDQNPNYSNITLTGLNGDVLAAGRTFTGTNLADRKHFQEALLTKDLVVGEYILTRVGEVVPAFAFAFPVLDEDGRPKAVLTTAIKLTSFAHLHDVSDLPEKSFVAVTDHKGIRLIYYPAQEKTNPVGNPIKAKSWEMANKAQEPGIFIGAGSDGMRKIMAFEQVRLAPEDTPYLYVWAGLPEAHILAPANAALSRNLIFMLLATMMSLFISWVIGQKTLIAPIQNLVTLTRKFAQGDLESNIEFSLDPGEVGILTNAFYEMANALTTSQRSLRENEERFRTVANFAYDWEYWIDPHGGLKYLSPSCQRITGYSPEEFLKDENLLTTICLPEYRDIIHKHLSEENIKDDPATSIDFRIQNKDGEILWINHICQPIIGEDGKFLGRRACNRDITDRKRLEEDLIKAKKLEATASLAGGISHDFNNLLSAILGFTELAKESLNANEEAFEFLENAQQASLRARDLTSKFITFSSGGAPVRRTVDINKFIEDSTTVILSGSNIRLNITLPPESWRVDIDKSQFTQVLSNIITNANEAMPDGGIFQIIIENVESAAIDKTFFPSLQENNYVKITFKDEGIGISEAELEKVFDPYFSTKERGADKGMGLGLTVVHSIVEKHNGYITIESNKAHGTSVQLLLPATVHEISKESEGAPKIPSLLNIPGEKGKILIMDDEEIVINVVSEMLSRQGYSCEYAQNGHEAIEKFKQEKASGVPFNLVIMDLTIPGGMGGEKAVKEVLKIDPHAKVVVASGYSADPIMEDYKKYGFCGAIAKPFLSDELLTMIKRL